MKNNLKKCFACFSLLLLLVSCEYKNYKNKIVLRDYSKTCILNEVDIEILDTNFPSFKLPLNEFYQDSSNNAVLHLCYSWRNNMSKSFLLSQKNHTLSLRKYDEIGTYDNNIDSIALLLDSLIKDVGEGSYHQDCPSVSHSHFTSHFFYVKKKGKIIFKYGMTPLSYKYLIEQDKTKIKGLIPIIDIMLKIESDLFK